MGSCKRNWAAKARFGSAPRARARTKASPGAQSWASHPASQAATKSVPPLVLALGALLVLAPAVLGQQALPPGASCRFVPRQPLARIQPVKSPGPFDELAPVLGQNTAVNMISFRNQQQQANPRQVVFASACDGWRNNATMRHDNQRPAAFWAFDQARGALVAKFVYYSREELKNMAGHETRLVSPLFRPVPAYHSMKQSKYYNSCQIAYSSYFTIPGQLTLTLLLKPAARSRSYDLERYQIQSNFKGKSSFRHNFKLANEPVWEQHQLNLPFNLNDTAPYRLEFSVSSAMPETKIFQENEFMHAIAITNISLSPLCFGLGAEQDELDRLRLLTGREPLVFGPSWDQNESPPMELELAEGALSNLIGQFLVEHRTPLFILFLLLLTCILTCQYTLYMNYQKDQIRRQAFVSRSGSVELRCFCLPCLPVAREIRRKGGDRVHAADAEQAKLAPHFENQQNGGANLVPLRYILGSERLELVENQNYQSSMSEAHRLAATERALHDSLHKFHIDRSRLSLTDEIGKGAFGRVYRGCLLCDDNYGLDGDGSNEATTSNETSNSLSASSSHSVNVAVKTCDDGRVDPLDFMREASNMATTRHRNIVQLFGVCFDEKPFYIVMELCQGGNLKSFLMDNRPRESPGARSNQCFYYNASNTNYQPMTGQPQAPSRPKVNLSMGDLLVFALDIARACSYLQKLQFVHRDLAARNCLLTSNTRAPSADAQQAPSDSPSINPDDREALVEELFTNGYQNSSMVAKLADFGMTRDVQSYDYYRTAHKEMPVRWMPPESLDGVATLNSDVWSFGVLLWELFSLGQLPYQHLPDNRQVIEFIRSRRHARPSTPEDSTRAEVSPARQPAKQPSSTPADATTELLLTISEENLSLEQPADQVRLISGRLVSVERDSGSSSLPSSDKEPAANEHGWLASLANGGSERQREGPAAAELPPLPLPHNNTPEPIYAIMCACWANEPENRPTFEQVCFQLCDCLQNADVLATSLPHFYDDRRP